MCWMEKEKYYLLNVTSFWIYKIRLLVWRISDKSFFFELLGYLRWNMCYKEKVYTTKNRNRSGKIACNKVLSSPMYFILNRHRQKKILWIGCNRKIEWNCCEIITSYIEFMWLCIISSWYASLIVYHTFFQFPVQLFTNYLKLSLNIDIGTWAPPITIFESCKMSPLKFCYFNDMHVIVSNPFKRHIIVTFSHSNLVFIHLLKSYNLIRNNLANVRFRNSVHKIIFFRRQTCKYARIPFLIWTFRLTYVKRHSLNFWEFVLNA